MAREWRLAANRAMASTMHERPERSYGAGRLCGCNIIDGDALRDPTGRLVFYTRTVASCPQRTLANLCCKGNF